MDNLKSESNADRKNFFCKHLESKEYDFQTESCLLVKEYFIALVIPYFTNCG